MDAYRAKNGQQLTMYQVEFVVGKYEKHRSVPESIINELYNLSQKSIFSTDILKKGIHKMKTAYALSKSSGTVRTA